MDTWFLSAILVNKYHHSVAELIRIRLFGA